jgi:hypothetical protein
MWGEGHTHGSVPQDNFEIKKLHIDLHKKYFRNSLLCISDDFAGHDNRSGKYPIIEYALAQGVTLRDDSILVQPPPRSWYHAEMAQVFWPHYPVILEHQHYGPSVNNKAWSKDLLLKSVEDYRASFMSIHWWPRILLNENRDVIDKINLRMGYRLMPVEVIWPAKLKIGEHFKVQWQWVNKGVAPCYPGGYPALTLKDETGGIVSVLSDESLDLRNLKTAAPGKAPVLSHTSEFVIGLIAPATKPGVYTVYVSVGMRDGTPHIALPLKDDDGQRRYELGSIILEK